jgi:hypothetical protein
MPFLAFSGLATSAVAAVPRVSHKQVQAIKVTDKSGSGATLQSMTRTSDGRIVALLGASRYGGINFGASKPPEAAIQVFDKEGTELTRWKIEIKGQAVGAGPDGSIFVGGNGKIAKYDADGKLLNEFELPHLAAMLADKEGLKQRAKEQIESQKNSNEQMKKTYAKQIDVLKVQIAKIEETEADDLSDADKRKLKRLKQQLTSYQSIRFADDNDDSKIEVVIQQLVQRASTISGISVTANDVFVVTGEEKGYGFAAWRMDQNFENPTKVLSELRGCCGQMDVQAVGNDLFVAENTKHRVGHYDRDGKRLEEFGSTASRGNADGFGGCCNPMNVCFGPSGQILTAESEGIIRRFSATGEYLGLVGRVTLTGGCKNVAVSATPDGERVYFCDLPGSKIIVMGPVTDDAEAEALAKPPKPAPGAPVVVDDDADDGSANEKDAAEPSAKDEKAQESNPLEEGTKKTAAQNKARKLPARAIRIVRPSPRQPLRTRVYADPGF